MAEKDPAAKHTWIAFIGVVLLLLGIYGFLRTVLNIYAYDKYPQLGVYSVPFLQGGMMMSYIGPSETDCGMMPYPGDQSLQILPMVEKQAYEQQTKEQCLSQAKQSRENAKTSDISQSMLFLFMGAGILVAKKFLFS